MSLSKKITCSGREVFTRGRRGRRASNFTLADSFVLHCMVSDIYSKLDCGDKNVFGMNAVLTVRDDVNSYVEHMFKKDNMKDLTQQRFTIIMAGIKKIVEHCTYGSENEENPGPISQFTAAFSTKFYKWMTWYLEEEFQDKFIEPETDHFKHIIQMFYENGFTLFQTDENGVEYVRRKYITFVLSESESLNIKDEVEKYFNTNYEDTEETVLEYMHRMKESDNSMDNFYYYCMVGNIYTNMVNNKQIRRTINVHNFYDHFYVYMMEKIIVNKQEEEQEQEQEEQEQEEQDDEEDFVLGKRKIDDDNIESENKRLSFEQSVFDDIDRFINEEQ